MSGDVNPDECRWRRPGQLAVLFLILAGGLAIRLWRLDEVPAGLSHDEAYDALNAVDILDGLWPVFFEANNGRETLFMYLVALSFRAFGVGPFQLRLVSALAGTAAIGLLYLLARRLFGWRVALLAAALVAVSFWPLYDSRLGLRASLLPALETLAAYGLWRWFDAEGRGRRGRPLGWAGVAGVALGAGLHTYTPARFAPLIALGFAGYLALAGVVPWRRALSGLAVTLAVAALVFAPLAAYFVAHPGSLGGRTGQVNDLRFILQEGDFRPLVEDTLNTVGMFSVRGDSSMRYNLAGRPVFDPVSSILFYLGVLACLLALGPARGIADTAPLGSVGRAACVPAGESTGVAGSSPADAHPERPDAGRARSTSLVAAPAAALVLLWLGVGLLPSATTGESPHFLRAIGAQPVVYVFPALGLAIIGRWLHARLTNAPARSGRTLGIAAIALVALTAGLAARDYFVVWNESQEARHIYGAPYATVARLLSQPPAERTFITGEYPADLDRFVVDVLRGLRPSDASWFDGRVSLVFPANGPATYFFARSARPPDDLLRRFFPGSDPAGDPELCVVQLPGRPELAPARRHSARLGDYLELVGYDLPVEVPAGGRLRITMYWKVLARPAEDISLYAHLMGAVGSLWGQHDGLGYPLDQWQPGDLLVEWHDVPVPVGAPPVDYQVEAGAYLRSSGQRLPVRSAQGTADRLRLGAVRVVRPAALKPPTVETSVGARFGDVIRLRGFDLAPRNPARGDRLRLTLYWESLAPTNVDYTVFNHLVLADARPRAQEDGPPAFGAYATSAWLPGDLVRDVHEIALPADLRPGRYWLLTGLYVAPDGPRLAPAEQPSLALARLGRWLERHTPYQAGPRVDGDRVVLGTVDVRSRR